MVKGGSRLHGRRRNRVVGKLWMGHEGSERLFSAAKRAMLAGKGEGPLLIDRRVRLALAENVHYPSIKTMLSSTRTARTCRSRTVSTPRRPARTMRIFSSVLWVARRENVFSIIWFFFFGLNGVMLGQSLTRLNRRALVITDTDDRLIAAAAIIGESNMPVTG